MFLVAARDAAGLGADSDSPAATVTLSYLLGKVWQVKDHYVLWWEGKFYDARDPGGVSTPKALGYVKRYAKYLDELNGALHGTRLSASRGKKAGSRP